MNKVASSLRLAALASLLTERYERWELLGLAVVEAKADRHPAIAVSLWRRPGPVIQGFSTAEDQEEFITALVGYVSDAGKEDVLSLYDRIYYRKDQGGKRAAMASFLRRIDIVTGARSFAHVVADEK